MVETCSARLYGIDTTIESDSEPFQRFAAETLAPYQAGETTPVLATTPTSLHVTVSLGRMVSPDVFLRGTERLGRSVGLAEGGCRAIVGRLAVETRWTSGELRVMASLTEGATWPGRVRRLMNRASWASGDDYFLFFRHAVWFPLFGLLARRFGVFVVHGAALDVGGRGVLLAGLSGTGKTTASLVMVLAGRATLVADNYVLFDGRHIYPFIDWLRLTSGALGRLPGRERLGTVRMRRFSRSYYQAPRELLGGTVTPDVVLLPRLGEQGGCRGIGAAEAVDQVLATTDASREFSRHGPGGLADLVIPSNGSSYGAMIGALDTLVRGCRAAEVTLGPGDGLDDVVSRMLGHGV